MGQCVSRGHKDPYGFVRQYDSESVSSGVYGVRGTKRGHSESKGARKRDKSLVTNGNPKPSRGLATSFGFRRRPASTSRAEDNARRRQKPQDNNGNRGSTEDLRVEDILSGRSTPLARPRKDAQGQSLRTNRFGFRQATSKSSRVGDVNTKAEHAFNIRDKDTAINKFNNNAFDKKSTNSANPHIPMSATQVNSNGSTTIIGAGGLPKTVTKQTVILTYQPQQYNVQETRARPPSGRSSSATRAYGGSDGSQRPPGKYSFQTNQLPRAQYPSVKNVDYSKNAKQVVNSSRKSAGNQTGWIDDGQSAVSSESGVCTESSTGAGDGDSPRSRRRPRNLEMVMRNAHSFHLRELHVADLDIMDDAVVTGESVIPLPKFPSSFNDEQSPDYEVNPVPSYRPPSPIVPLQSKELNRSGMSTLERYRRRPNRIQNVVDSRDEGKLVLDRSQVENMKKQNSVIRPSTITSAVSPATVNSSKESSPSCKSEESHFEHSVTETWQTQAAGEAMANRSQDDASIALSISSCEDEKSKLDCSDIPKNLDLDIPKTTVLIMDDPPAPHPLLMKSSTLTDPLRGNLMSSLTSSNYSTTSTCTNQSNSNPLTLTLEKFEVSDSKFDISVLEVSTHSMLEDETSPADSLLSSTSSSSSNNDLRIERESASSSAYQTANTKTKSPEPEAVDEDEVDGEVLKPIIENGESGEACKNSPGTPGTPTHASGSLSLSDGRDFFDDEIADQPGLLFRKNNENSPSTKTVESEAAKLLRRSRERLMGSPLTQRNRKGGKCGAAERTPSLDTLSSLASDDLMMMDNELGRSITSLQSVDDYIERLDSSLRSGINSMDEHQLQAELSSSQSAVRQWSQLLEQSNMLDRQLAAITQNQGHRTAPHSLAASTTSLASLGASLPVRTARLLQRSRVATPSDGLSDGTSSPAPHAPSLLQDVVDIKTLLLQLKRVLQEPGEEQISLSSETLDPLWSACEEVPARGYGRVPPSAATDMKRQILYLQSQLEERDRVVRSLQHRLDKMADLTDTHRTDDTCNVATQTDRLRPPSTMATSNGDSGLVSWNEQQPRKLQTYNDVQKKRSMINGNLPIKCTCGARKYNGEEPNDNTSVKTNSRVGTKYLQALADNTRRYVKRDSSLGDKTIRKTIYSSRSKSIENFHNQIYSTKESKTKNVIEETQIKHHTSYGDLYNGRISSKESVDSRSPLLNGQSTDTDYSSDGGYKSLPSNINCRGNSPRKISGIPRRSIEQRLVPAKHVKASAI